MDIIKLCGKKNIELEKNDHVLIVQSLLENCTNLKLPQIHIYRIWGILLISLKD